jgi:tripartite-type tricarboxylate transporter receptor subunit TctC
VPFVQLANPQVPAKTIRELIEIARKSPGKLKYASAGAGASEHLCGFMFAHMIKADMLHVPYKGIPQALADTLAGDTQLTYAVYPAARPHIDSGRLRALGVTTPRRSPSLPDVPAIAEAVPGYAMFGWYSLVAPIGTPDAVLQKASAEVIKAVKEPDFGEKLKTQGIEVVGGGRKELDAFRRDERRRISELVKASGVDLK